MIQGMPNRPSHMITLVLSLLLAACDAGQPYALVKGERFLLEVANDDASRSQGLMFRDEMADNRGMLFIFPDQQPRSFWMKNTRIPLDIIYLSRQLRVVSISENTPPCRSRSLRCPSYPSAGPAQYVLEINGGQARRLGLEPGDHIELGNVEQLH